MIFGFTWNNVWTQVQLRAHLFSLGFNPTKTTTFIFYNEFYLLIYLSVYMNVTGCSVFFCYVSYVCKNNRVRK